MTTSSKPPNWVAAAADVKPPEDSRNLTPDEHRARHVLLHQMLDELFADYIMCHPKQHRFMELTIGELLDWSSNQAICPDELPGDTRN